MSSNAAVNASSSLSLLNRLSPEFLADPYPLYERLRTEDPVHWDPYLHAWVVTSYFDAVTVLQDFVAARMPTAEQLTALKLSELNPIAELLVRQMIFMDPPRHTRLRALAASAFTPRRVEALRARIQHVTDTLIDAVLPRGHMDVIGELADVLPATVTAELMGVPESDRDQLKSWSKDFSELLGSFQHNPGRAAPMLRTIEQMKTYFCEKMREQERQPRDGVLRALMAAEQDGVRLTQDEVIANCIITMTGGQETTTNLIGNGVLTLLQNPQELARVRGDLSLLPTAIEELLRYESPIQHTARLAPADLELGGKRIRERDAVIAVIGAANRDSNRFPEANRLDVTRRDNRHLAFAWGAHYCFGASLARVEGGIAISTILRRLHKLALVSVPLAWRKNTGFRGLDELRVTFEPAVATG